MSAHIEAASPHTMNTYGRLPIALSHGQGCRVWDVNGKPYLDALAGTWSAEDLAEFRQATSAFEEVDPSLWKQPA